MVLDQDVVAELPAELDLPLRGFEIEGPFEANFVTVPPALRVTVPPAIMPEALVGYNQNGYTGCACVCETSSIIVGYRLLSAIRRAEYSAPFQRNSQHSPIVLYTAWLARASAPLNGVRSSSAHVS